MPTSAWGDAVTRYFFDLTPDRVLGAMEAAGYACTGLCWPLGSYENRVYEVEVREDAARGIVKKDVSSLRRVVKFYRPGRWSRAQIQEEHDFLRDLVEDEIPAVAPERFESGETVAQTPGVEGELWYTVFPRVGGRSPDDLSDEQLERLGRLLARIHNVGAAREAKARIALTPETYGLSNLEFLLARDWLPPEVAKAYEGAAREICRISEDLFRGVRMQRIHGDCHPGNLLWSDRGPFFVDFDDMVRGPAVQDVWLLLLRQEEPERPA
ncbi:MAG: serine/threonine protein kinase, partial [Candidatus Methylomirabilis sp.]|nr:serine/threonine protein kinase [Deltaproteobacteria bacterium]